MAAVHENCSSTSSTRSSMREEELFLSIEDSKETGQLKPSVVGVCCSGVALTKVVIERDECEGRKILV
jgi:hypothetical protein